METLFVYLIKSGGLLAAFFLAYYFLLRKETFFNSNRWFLLLGLVTSLLLPLVTFKKVVWVDAVKIPGDISWHGPIAAPANEGFEMDWLMVMALVYAIGIFISLIKFIFDFSNLVKTLKGQKVKQQADFKFVDVSHNVSPFSYFNYIVYNSSLYSPSELENILEHEKVHCEQKHSADVLIARLFCILFWFNPFAWLYKKAMLQNLEFIADSEALKNINDKRAYQITLLKVTTHENCVEITNHFFQSLIKKRIIMLNKNQSKRWNSWKYALILPVLAAFMFYFQVKVIAQERNNPEEVSAAAAKPVSITLNKNTTDAQLNAYTQEFKKQFGAKLKFSKVRRNSTGEIVEIKVQYEDKSGKDGSWHVREDKPINPLRLQRKDDGSIAFGGDKEIRIVHHRDGNSETVTEIEEAVPSAPPVPGCTKSYTYSYGTADDHDIEAPEPPDMADFKDHVFVKTITNKDGKVTVTVNGEVIDVDTDKILADIDIDKITKEAMKHAELARVQIEAARPQMERARRQIRESNIDSEEARNEMEEARRDMENAKRDLEEARKEIEASRKELEKQRAEYSKAKAARSKNK